MHAAEGLARSQPKPRPALHRGAQPQRVDGVEPGLSRRPVTLIPSPRGDPDVGCVLGFDVDAAEVAEPAVGVADEPDHRARVLAAVGPHLIEPVLQRPVQQRTGAAVGQQSDQMPHRRGRHLHSAIVVAALQHVCDLQAGPDGQRRQIEAIHVL